MLLIKRHCERSTAIDNTCVTVERKRNVSRKGGNYVIASVARQSRRSVYVRLCGTPPSIAGIATVASLLRNDVLIERHSEVLPKPPRQVAPSPPRYACHLSRFNGRAYSRKGSLQIPYISIYIMIYTPRPILPVKKRKNKKLKILSKIVEKCLTLKYGYVKMSRLSMR